METTKDTKSTETNEKTAKRDLSEAVCSLWLVVHNGFPAAAYPRKKQAEVYASGFSALGSLEIIEGTFIANAAGELRLPGSDARKDKQ